jgi:glycosyltransferase involved in cell wall biosynthesis
MNILFVTYDFPYPANTGGKNRAFNLIKNTAKDANIFLYSFVREDFNPDFCSELLKIGTKDIKVFKRKKMKSVGTIFKSIFSRSSIFKTLYFEKKVRDEILLIVKEQKIDIVHFESSYTGYYIGKGLSRRGVKMVLGTENIEFKLYFDYGKNLKNPLAKPFVFLQAGRLKKEEIKMVRNADAVTTITKEEADIFKSETNKDIFVVANGIDPNEFQFEKKRETYNNILFVGNFSYFPNVDAVNFFYNEVFKKIDRKINFTIIGKEGKNKFKFNDPRVIFKEYVEDIVSEYRKSDMLVFPIRIGGGTNFKVLEAMALGTPIVAFPERLQGLKAIPGEHFLEASTPNEYLLQIEKIYGDLKLVDELTLNARKLIEKKYAWSSIGNDLLNVWEKTI